MMANSDIVFNGEIRIDTKEAEKSISKLSKQLEGVFQKTSTMIGGAIKTNTFGFSSVLPEYGSAMSDTLGIMRKHINALKPLPEKPTAGQRAAYNKKVADLQEMGRKYRSVVGLMRFMEALAPYDNLYNDIVGLRESVVNGTMPSEKGLGRYNVKQRFANSLMSTLYRYRHIYPGIVTEGALEIGEKHRDRNRKTGSQSRAELRYTQDKEYWAKAYERAANYMLLDDDNSTLQQLSNIYDFGLEPSVKSKPRTFNQKAYDLVSMWAERGISAQKHKEALEEGNLSKSDKAYHFEWYKKDMAAFIKLQQKLFPEEKTIAENLKKLNASTITEFGGAGGAMKLLGAGGIIGVATKILSDGVQMMETAWGERVTRNVYASKQAYYKRWEIGGQAAGVGGGAALGAAIGSIIPGVGTAIGAAAGAAIGGILGPIYGKYQQTQLQANIVSTDQMINRVRNAAMFGKGYNSWFAQAMDQMGVGQGGMAELANNAMSLRARMMLGQVSEYDMLYYSMMPNYYAALMAGITGPELARIYEQDLKGIGDPSMRYVVGQAIGGQNAFAMVNNDYFGGQYASLSRTAAKYEGLTNILTAGYMRAKNRVENENIGKGYKELVRTARQHDPDFYEDPNVFIEGQNRSYIRRFTEGSVFPGGGAVGGLLHLLAPDLVEKMMDRNDLSKTTFVNIIKLPDDTVIKQDVKTADEIYLNSYSQYVGG